MAMRQPHQQQHQHHQHHQQHNQQHHQQHNQQRSWPESIASMPNYSNYMSMGGILGATGATDMAAAAAAAAHMSAHIPSHPAAPAPASSLSMGNNPMHSAMKEERVGQWSHQETKDFIAIRSELDRDFTQAKRNKSLWEAIASKMKDKGYHRTGEQCKLKWKNLYNRYKAATTSQAPDSCPFYEELHAIFSDPRRGADHSLYAEFSTSKTRKRAHGEISSEEISDEEEDEDDDSEEVNKAKRLGKKVRKADAKDRTRSNSDRLRSNSMQEVLEDFLQQQHRLEMEWMGAWQRREEDRRRREQDWREAMKELEMQRIAREEGWREKEEQWRVREEMRAQRRDALIAAILSKLTKDE
ncbi:hypothetical protein KP509_35G046600 [Ceratopteris richardii]|uniref:Myb-like domain-containing protein n=2 Tax=Ceratopteris richardii TaxID=49495 RepID=A0A8T2QHS5_CERRI|nr:hypothetical protein KP509_35G046600 [Ceratopteris richardii]